MNCVSGQYVVWALVLTLGLSDGVAAATLRCGAKVIQVGDSDLRARTHCGEPDSIKRQTRSFPDGGRLDDRFFYGAVTVENWHYERGYAGIPAPLLIVDGKVERIRLQTGGYQARWTTPCQ